jgi:quercetin dioxygenase-like cupin family protein
MERREFMTAVAMLAAAAESAAAQTAGQPRTVLTQDLPPVSLNGWTATAVELTYAPGAVSQAHKHPGFVLGYVLEGSIRFAINGGEPVVRRTGEMFYEPPGAVHTTASNASATAPARFLAIIIAERGAPVTSAP